MAIQGNKIVLVEVGGSHDECLLTQLLALETLGYSVKLICTENIKERNPHFIPYIDEWQVVDAGQSKGQQASAIWKGIKEWDPEKVVFNTSQGGVIRNVAMKALFSKIEFIGIIHTTRKFEGSFTQKLINLKIKKYLLLSEFLHSKISHPKRIKTSYFYPIDYPGQDVIFDSFDEQQIAILGGVESRRKDLEGFIEILKKLETKLTFVFLGKSDNSKDEVNEFRATLEKEGLLDYVRLYDQFVKHSEFNKVIRESALILPLVHPDTPSADQYFKNQISGAANVAFGYRVPLLIHKAYAHVTDMQDCAVYYDGDNFEVAYKAALKTRAELIRNIEAKYDFKEQQNRYIKFLFD